MKCTIAIARLRPRQQTRNKEFQQLHYNRGAVIPMRFLRKCYKQDVREGATKLQPRNCLKEISRRKQTLVNIPRLG
jgi:hypothetical protein